MIVFEADKKPLHFLLDQVDQQQVALPDFQRSFVWNPADVRELLVSVFSSYPAGSLLLLQGGAQVFAPRPVESAPALIGQPPYLVLDGQQRLTSLYQAFRGTGTHRFFLNVEALVRNLRDGGEMDIDDALEVFPAKRSRRWSDIDGQAQDLMIPVAGVRRFTQWMFDVIARRPQDDLQSELVAVQNEVVRSYEQYQFPVTTLASSTPTAAVCSIFETLNRTGKKLSVFELLTARAFASGHRLRDMWSASKSKHPILEEFGIDPYDLLQVVAVWTKGGSKRSQVLAMTPEELVGRWDDAAENMAHVLTLLRHECGALAPRWVPYAPAVVTMTAVWPAIASASGPEVGARRSKLKKWFWIASFSGRYDNAAGTAITQDSQWVKSWLEGGTAPDYITRFRFDRGRWHDVSPRQRALYRASMALLMADGPLDFHSGHPLTQQIIESAGVDDHHIFPRAYLAKTGQEGPVDSILNRTLIDRLTNISIGAKPPSKYLANMKGAMGEQVDLILASHHVPLEGPGSPYNDDFRRFLSAREQKLASLLEAAVGQPLVPEEQVSESEPASDSIERFRDAVGDLWAHVEPLLEDTSATKLEALLDSVRTHMGSTFAEEEARRVGNEVEGLLDRWAEYDAQERRIAHAVASYFLKVDDDAPDTHVHGLDDDLRVVRAARGVFEGWKPDANPGRLSSD